MQFQGSGNNWSLFSSGSSSRSLFLRFLRYLLSSNPSLSTFISTCSAARFLTDETYTLTSLAETSQLQKLLACRESVSYNLCFLCWTKYWVYADLEIALLQQSWTVLFSYRRQTDHHCSQQTMHLICSRLTQWGFLPAKVSLSKHFLQKNRNLHILS